MKKNKNIIIIITIIMGLISGLSIVLFPKLVQILGLSWLDFTSSTENFKNQFIFFGGYLAILILIMNIILSKFKISKLFITNIIIFAILFVSIGIFGENFITTSALKYYLFVALGEEFIKYFLGISFYEKMKISKGDILIFSILSGIGFAFIENFVYLFSAMGGADGILEMMVGGISILISRGIIGFIVHILFTGNIGYFALKGLGKNIIVYSLIGIIFGTTLHYFYDLLLYNGVKIAIIIALVGGYFWLSFLFYNSDRLYINKGLNPVYN